MTGDGRPVLLDHHRELLHARAISDAVIADRGYTSTTIGRWLHDEAGFSHAVAALTPGLVIPVRDVTGRVRFHQYRPDRPRTVRGRPAKYELPREGSLVVDVPPAVVHKVAAAGAPLWVTESPVKADALVTAGAVAVGLFGVWGWRGVNKQGGSTLLADWEAIDLADRSVYLVPDSDVAVNVRVHDAMTRLGSLLVSRGANVYYVDLPPAADGGKQGVDDWLARNGPDLRALTGMSDDRPPAKPPRPAPTAPLMAAAERLTDAGYALRLLADHGQDMRYCGRWKSWLVWDGQRWIRDDRNQVDDWAAEVARSVTDGIDPRDREEWTAAHRRESEPRIRGSVKIASADQRFAVLPTDLDADPFLLNTATGTIDLRTMTRRNPDRADLITKITRGGFDPGAGSAEWDKFLSEVQPDETVRGYLARLTGLALEGRVVEHVLPVHYGEGGNGKTTFFEACAWALGDYAISVDIEMLLERQNQGHPTAIAELFGARLVIAREAEANRRLAEATVKWLTGGDQITARHLYERNFTFAPSHTFALFTNNRPVVTQNDRGIWRRLRLVPWSVEIDKATEDGELGDRLKASATAVLAWLLAGYADWKACGLAEPGEIADATKEWQQDSDTVARFIAQRCVTTAQATVLTADLFKAWQAWAEGERVFAGSQRALGIKVERLGFERWRNAKGERGFRGLTVTDEDITDPWWAAD